MGRYVGRQEKTGAEGSGDRCSPVPRKESTVGTTILQEPRKDEGRTFLIDWKRRIDLIVIVSFLNWIHEESMGWRELEKRPRSQSFDGVFAWCIAASFSACFFLSSCKGPCPGGDVHAALAALAAFCTVLVGRCQHLVLLLPLSLFVRS